MHIRLTLPVAAGQTIQLLQSDHAGSTEVLTLAIFPLPCSNGWWVKRAYDLGSIPQS